MSLGRSPELTGCAEEVGGFWRSRPLVLAPPPYFASRELFGSSEQLCELGRQRHLSHFIAEETEVLRGDRTGTTNHLHPFLRQKLFHSENGACCVLFNFSKGDFSIMGGVCILT